MSDNKKYYSIVDHYESCLEKHGDNHLGVDWPRKEEVDIRYKVMLEVVREDSSKNINLLDFGCGASHLYDYILKHKLKNIKYAGLDLSKKYIDLCKKKYPEIKYYCVDILENNVDVPEFDYIIMNGVFTEKRDLSFDDMFAYLKRLTSVVFKKSKKGLVFNVMSKTVDWEREDLFHLPTDLLIDFLTKKITRNIIIRNDYGLYEYSVYLYHNPYGINIGK